MPRKYESTEKFLKGDPQFNSKVVAKFINCLMWDGKKTTAQKLFYDALDMLKVRVPDEEPLDVFLTALGNVKPLIEVRSKRVGGATLQVPHEIRKARQQALAEHPAQHADQTKNQQRGKDENSAQQKNLWCHGAQCRVGELGQKREEKQRQLGVEQVHQRALVKHTA